MRKPISKEKRAEYLANYYRRLKQDPVRWERFCKQSLASYHRRKGSLKEREKRDRYNAKRRKGPAKGNYGPRSPLPEYTARAYAKKRVYKRMYTPKLSFDQDFI